MNKKGISQVGEFVPDNLIAGNRHPVDVCHVVIKKGETLLRGSVLMEDATEAGKYVLLGSGGASDEEETQKAAAEYILAENTDASLEDTVALAYRSGEFAENALLVKEGYEITDQDRKDLRSVGIFLQTIMM